MKILLLTNNVQDTTDMTAGIAQAKTWASTIGLDLEFTIENTTKQFTSLHYANDVNPDGYIVDPTQIFQEAKSFNVPFDACILIFDAQKITGGTPTNPADNGDVIQMSTEWYNGYSEVFAQFLLHELCHALFSESNLPDITHFQYQSAEYHNSPNQAWYLYLLTTLKTYWPTTMPTYKYFQPNEIVGLVPALVTKLDTARGIAGVPFVITSGLRTVADNTAVGGVQGSTHELAEAVDIACTDQNRLAILTGAIQAGFNRIGIYTAHIHLDIGSAPAFPQNVSWVSGNE